jgi:hypothetical protein
MKKEMSELRQSFLIKALLSLIFISKISFAVFLVVPREFSFLIFQHGLHPYLNMAGALIFGLPLMLLWIRGSRFYRMNSLYFWIVFFLIAILCVQTFFQITYVNTEDSPLLQIGSLLMSVFMVLVYGVAIPSLWSVDRIVSYVKKWSSTLVFISMLLLPIAGSVLFKGGRFIGIFKHIPHMVTCATVAFILNLNEFLYLKNMKHNIWSVVLISLSFFAILMTGTRSSVLAALGAAALILIFHKVKTHLGLVFKISVLSFILSFTVFFGLDTLEYAQAVATGKAALGGRQAQDGVGSRWDEVLRGYEIFKEQPWLGHGLLSKFTSGHDVDVSNYNAMKDPHNMFISAGVTGGWPLILWSLIAVLVCLAGGLWALSAVPFPNKQIAVYVLTHLPILMIYHVHLSIGGMADRIYWLMFGMLAVLTTKNVLA